MPGEFQSLQLLNSLSFSLIFGAATEVGVAVGERAGADNGGGELAAMAGDGWREATFGDDFEFRWGEGAIAMLGEDDICGGRGA